MLSLSIVLLVFKELSVTNIITLLGLLVKLLPFLKEVFLKNKDFRDAVTNNKSFLAIFMACIILFTVNLDQVDSLVTNQQRIKDLSRGFEEIKHNHDQMALELSKLQLTTDLQLRRVHELEVLLAQAQQTIKLREEHAAELKETLKATRNGK